MALHRPHGLLAADYDELVGNERILRAALEAFVEKGYHGTSVRDIATRAGISVPGLYHHYSSKAVLLERLIDETMDDLIEQTRVSLAAAGDDPLDQFVAIVEAHVRFHCERPEESFIGNSELRSLSPAALKRIVSKRDRQQRFFDRATDAGIEAGFLTTEWPKEAARGIVTMCTAVATWFKRTGKLSPDEVVRIYRDLALRTAGYADELPSP